MKPLAKTSKGPSRTADLIAPYILWAFFLFSHLIDGFLSHSPYWLTWQLKCILGFLLIFFVPGYSIASLLPRSDSGASRLNRAFDAIIINILFLILLATAVKLFSGRLEFSTLVIAWFLATVVSTVLEVFFGAPVAPTDNGPKILRGWAVVIVVATILILASPSKSVHEEHWFSDKFDSPMQFRHAFSYNPVSCFADDSFTYSMEPAFHHKGANRYHFANDGAVVTIKNLTDKPIVAPLKWVFQNHGPQEVSIRILVANEPPIEVALQSSYSIYSMGYGYPPANVFVEIPVLIPTDSVDVTIEIPTQYAYVTLAVYDFTKLDAKTARKQFNDQFVFGDVADNREMLNLARDLRTHLFTYQRFYADDAGAPGIAWTDENKKGGLYWNNFPLHPFIQSVGLVLIKDSIRTLRAISNLEVILLFMMLFAGICMIQPSIGKSVLLPLALVVITYFLFVRPGVESNTRQALQDLLMVLSILFLLKGQSIRFIFSALLFMLTNFSGFGLLVVILGFRILTAENRRRHATLLGIIVAIQIAMTTLLTWLFKINGSAEYWNKIQGEWWNRYEWVWDWVQTLPALDMVNQPMGLVRVGVWVGAATFLLPLTALVYRNKETLFLPLTFLFYTATVALMEKPRGHYISTLIVLAALSGIPYFEKTFWENRSTKALWLFFAGLSLTVCYFHAKLYIYTEDFILPIFPAQSFLERILEMF